MALTKVTYSMISPEIYNKGRLFHQPFLNGTKIVRDETSFHRHFGSVAEGFNGKLHMVYRRGPGHGVASNTTIQYCYSNDGGFTWSAETQIVEPEAGIDMRECCLGVTPTGRILMTYNKVRSPAAAPTIFKLKYSDDNGETWLDGSDIDTINFAYARVYGRPKVITGNDDEKYRIIITPYFQVSASPSTFRTAAYYSDDDGLTWVEGVPIANQIGGYNECEIVQGSGDIGFAAVREAGIYLFQTLNAGVSWSLVGEIPSSDGVAPTADRFYYEGRVYIVVGYCDRGLNTGNFKIAEMQNILDIGVAAFGPALIVSTDMVNASGYQVTVTDPHGNLYVDGGTAFVEFKEYTNIEPGFPFSQVRFKRANLFGLLQTSAKSNTVASGAITVASTYLEPRMLVSTEGSAVIDDLDTINGGYEGQIVNFGSATSARDVVFKNGTGNLNLISDFRLNIAGISESRITLQKSGINFLELSRTNDPLFITKEVISGEITAGNATIPTFEFVEPEGSTGTDDLNTINGGYNGQIITFGMPLSSYSVIFKDNTGNLRLAGDFALTSNDDTITLIKFSTTWQEVARSDNA